MEEVLIHLIFYTNVSNFPGIRMSRFPWEFKVVFIFRECKSRYRNLFLNFMQIGRVSSKNILNL